MQRAGVPHCLLSLFFNATWLWVNSTMTIWQCDIHLNMSWVGIFSLAVGCALVLSYNGVWKKWTFPMFCPCLMGETRHCWTKRGHEYTVKLYWELSIIEIFLNLTCRPNYHTCFLPNSNFRSVVQEMIEQCPWHNWLQEHVKNKTIRCFVMQNTVKISTEILCQRMPARIRKSARKPAHG